jgi:hypothetical protein
LIGDGDPLSEKERPPDAVQQYGWSGPDRELRIARKAQGSLWGKISNIQRVSDSGFGFGCLIIASAPCAKKGQAHNDSSHSDVCVDMMTRRWYAGHPGREFPSHAMQFKTSSRPMSE